MKDTDQVWLYCSVQHNDVMMNDDDDCVIFQEPTEDQ